MNDEWNDWKKRGTDAAPLHRSFIACGSLTPVYRNEPRLSPFVHLRASYAVSSVPSSFFLLPSSPSGEALRSEGRTEDG